jgi:hypothetical protein
VRLRVDRDTQYGSPLLIDTFEGDATQPLKRVKFVRAGQVALDYDEAWLQRLVMKHPELLPVEQIEPAFDGLIPICMELPTRQSSAYLDGLLVTPSGDLALIECKLWRNPEAQREVVAQIIDYAKDVSSWDYLALEAAVKRSQFLGSGAQGKPQSLYEMVSPDGELDEASFIDAVSRNLKRGRFLLLIIGDGIREEIKGMADFLQQHAGLHFTLALVELALFKLPAGGYLAQPRVIARTINIDRGTVSINEAGRIAIGPSIAAQNGPTAATRMTITKEKYLEQIDANYSGISTRINKLIGKLETIGVAAEFGVSSMILRWPDETKGWNLGVIPITGIIFLDYLSTQGRDGFRDIVLKFLEKLAALVQNGKVRQNTAGTSWGVTQNNRPIRINDLLQDEAVLEGWLAAIAEFQADVRKSSQEDDNVQVLEPARSKSDTWGRPEIVLEVGGEGGSITLFRLPKAGGGWQFRTNINETGAYEALSEEDQKNVGEYVTSTGTVRSFEEAITLLDDYPWFQLEPLVLHPEYRGAVLREVNKRGGQFEETRWKDALRRLGERGAFGAWAG